MRGTKSRLRRPWKILIFDYPDELRRLESYWQSTSAGFLPEQHCIFDDGGVFTNLSERDLRRMAEHAMCDLPDDWLHPPDDDPQLLEVLSAHGYDLRGHPAAQEGRE